MDFYDKLSKIGLPVENTDVLEIPLKEISVLSSVLNTRIGRINARDIVGTTRAVAENSVWADILNNSFHKEYWLHPDRIKNIISILQNPKDEIYPCVVESNGEYYIDRDGLHRLVIAKLLDIENIPVCIKTCNNMEIKQD